VGSISSRQAIPADAPEVELDEDFWRNAEIVESAAPRKTSVRPRVDPGIVAFFQAGGPGHHLTRTAKVLKGYARSHGAPAGGRAEGGATV